MKIGINEINEGIHMIAVNKLAQALKHQGFSVSLGERNDLFDIYAEKKDDRRIYEIRTGKNKMQQRVLGKIQELAKEKGAKLFVSYLEQPRSKIIEYEGIEALLLDYLNNNMPEELDALSTHTRIQDISDVEINSIKIINDIIKMEGSAKLEVELLYGSEHDRIKGLGDCLYDFYEFTYRINVTDDTIISAYFKFDLEHFYE